MFELEELKQKSLAVKLGILPVNGEEDVKSFDSYHRITRLEVIDETGRVYTNWHPDNLITLSFQDGNRTLKVFIGKQSKATTPPPCNSPSRHVNR